VTAQPSGRRRTSGADVTSSYTELARTVRESGLMARRLGYYWSCLVVGLLGVAALGATMVWLGNSWLQLLVAAGLGVVLTQFGFLGHDAAHRQIFASPAWNEWTARLLSGLMIGLSYDWWRGKHTRHHARPNQVDRDPDIGSGALAMTAEVAAERHGVAGWMARHQGWLLFPLLTLEGVNLQLSGVRSLLASRDRHRVLELALVAVRSIGFVVLLLLLLPTGKAAAFFGIQMAVFGLLLGGSFAPNHIGMPIVPKGARIDFLRRQVLMSRNIRGGVVVDFLMGGLNYQIEHHLFPSMPRPTLRHVRPIVREYCAKHKVKYTEVGFFESYGIVIDYLNNVGLRARDPFQCPLTAAMRTR
jgi:fatty acid desaturase